MTEPTRHEHPFPLSCGACKHEWLATCLMPMPMMAWASWAKGIRCPSCGSAKTFLRTTPHAGLVVVTTPQDH